MPPADTCNIATEREPAIASEIHRLTAAVRDLEDSLNRLFDRLTPVMQPHPSNPGKPEQPPGLTQSKPPLAEVIAVQADKIFTAVESTREVLAALEV